MGSWGIGVFENDRAGDYVLEIINTLEDIIRSCLYLMINKSDKFRLCVAEFRLLPAIHIYYLVARVSEGSIPDTEVVHQWKNDFFAHWNKVRQDCDQSPEAENSLLHREYETLFDRLIFHVETWGENGYPETVSQIERPIMFDNFSFRRVPDQIMAQLQRDTISEFDEMSREPEDLAGYSYGEEIIVAITLMALISEKSNAYPPLPKQVHRWYKTFDKWWLEHHTWREEFYIKWQATYKETFDKLIQVSEDYQKRIQQEIAERRNQQKGKD